MGVKTLCGEQLLEFQSGSTHKVTSFIVFVVLSKSVTVKRLPRWTAIMTMVYRRGEKRVDRHGDDHGE